MLFFHVNFNEKSISNSFNQHKTYGYFARYFPFYSIFIGSTTFDPWNRY